MGTRGAIGFYKDGVDKITYNHFDSYPRVLGNGVKDFVLKYEKDLDKIFESIILVDADSKTTVEQKKDCLKYADLSVSEQSPDDWYCLTRKAQGDLEAYAKGLKYMIDNKDFLEDSLFCEWAYIINLDKRVLEIYVGFQKCPNDNRYSVDEPDGEYYNCKLEREVPFEKLSSFDMDSLEEEIKGE